jgi:hypothetical protein
MTSDLAALVRVLSGAGVEYVIVGGIAGNLHGAARTTLDLDIVYARSAENVARLVRALAPYAPYLRGAPAGLPFRLDEETISRGLNFTLTTSIGDLDLLGEITGGGGYERVKAQAQIMTLEGFECRVVNLPALIALKRAAGRGSDRSPKASRRRLRRRRPLRQRDHPRGHTHGTLGLVAGAGGIRLGVPLGRNQIDLAVERELPLLAQPGGRGGEPIDFAGHIGREARAVLLQQAADVVPVRGIDADLAQHPLQGQLDDLLGFSDHVGPGALVHEHRQDLEPGARLDQVALGERRVRHSENTSPGR